MECIKFDVKLICMHIQPYISYRGDQIRPGGRGSRGGLIDIRVPLIKKNKPIDPEMQKSIKPALPGA